MQTGAQSGDQLQIALQMPLILLFPFLIKIRIIFVLRRQRERTYKQFRSSAKKKAWELFLSLHLLSHQRSSSHSSQFWKVPRASKGSTADGSLERLIQNLRASSVSNPNSAVKDSGWNGPLLVAVSGVMTTTVVTNICPVLLVSQA